MGSCQCDSNVPELIVNGCLHAPRSWVRCHFIVIINDDDVDDAFEQELT